MSDSDSEFETSTLAHVENDNQSRLTEHQLLKGRVMPFTESVKQSLAVFLS